MPMPAPSRKTESSATIVIIFTLCKEFIWEDGREKQKGNYNWDNYDLYLGANIFAPIIKLRKFLFP